MPGGGLDPVDYGEDLSGPLPCVVVGGRPHSPHRLNRAWPGGGHARQAGDSEVVVEGDLAGDADLVSGHAPLEEVGQLLDVLQVHERQRVA